MANSWQVKPQVNYEDLQEPIENSVKVSANPKLTVLHNFGFLYDSINLRNSFRLKKKSQKNVIRTGSYLAKTILPS